MDLDIRNTISDRVTTLEYVDSFEYETSTVTVEFLDGGEATFEEYVICGGDRGKNGK